MNTILYEAQCIIQNKWLLAHYLNIWYYCTPPFHFVLIWGSTILKLVLTLFSIHASLLPELVNVTLNTVYYIFSPWCSFTLFSFQPISYYFIPIYIFIGYEHRLLLIAYLIAAGCEFQINWPFKKCDHHICCRKNIRIYLKEQRDRCRV